MRIEMRVVIIFVIFLRKKMVAVSGALVVVFF